MKILTAAVLLMVALAAPAQVTDKSFDQIMAGIEHYKKDSVVTEYALSGDDDPVTKKCRTQGWPATDVCMARSLGIVRALAKYFDNHLPGVPRPPFTPNKATK